MENHSNDVVFVLLNNPANVSTPATKPLPGKKVQAQDLVLL